MSIPHDNSRCHDDECLQRDICCRYLRRHDDGPRVCHVATFREHGVLECDALIPIRIDVRASHCELTARRLDEAKAAAGEVACA